MSDLVSCSRAVDPGPFLGNREIPLRDDLIACAILTAIWLIPIAVIGVAGNFPLNDDWAFARTAWTLLETGRFERIAWVYATAIPTTYIGALSSALLGPSFDTLRWSTVIMGWLGVLGSFALAREAGARGLTALVCACTIALNPIYLNLAFSFMSDVPFAVFCTWALAFAVRASRRSSVGSAGVAATFAALAISTRQPGLALPLSAAAAGFFVTNGRVRRNSTIGLVIAGAIATAWIVAGVLQGPVNSRDPFTLTRYVREFLLDGHPLYHLVVNGSKYTPYLGLMLLPVLAALRPPGRWGGRAELAALAAAAIAFLSLLMLGWRMPFGGNIVHDTGLGPITLHGCRALFEAPVPVIPWWLATAAACVGTALLAVHLLLAPLRGWPRPRERFASLLLLIFPVALVVALAIRSPFFDRYLLAALPPLAALVATGGGEISVRTTRRMLAAAALIAIGAFAIAGTRDYLEHHRARWALLTPLLESGVATDRIDGGFEFGGLHVFGNYDSTWAISLGDEYLLSYSSAVEGYSPIDTRPYRRLIPPHEESVTLHHRDSPSRREPLAAGRCDRSL